jgi:hypothetical protein
LIRTVDLLMRMARKKTRAALVLTLRDSSLANPNGDIVYSFANPNIVHVQQTYTRGRARLERDAFSVVSNG